MGNLCIIPARGGSKRIPRKNIKDFLGKPIIAYSIEVALASNLFDEVMVSTDDEEIAKVAENYGAKVPFFRSAATSDDFATTVNVLLEVVHRYEDKGMLFENACCIYATAPLIQVDDLVAGYNKLLNEERDTVFPVVSFSSPIWRGLRESNDNRIEMVWPEHLNSRSQDLEEVFHDAGQWYWFTIQRLLETKKLYSEDSGSVKLNQMQVQDIDNLVDWQLAELKYRLLNKNKI